MSDNFGYCMILIVPLFYIYDLRVVLVSVGIVNDYLQTVEGGRCVQGLNNLKVLAMAQIFSVEREVLLDVILVI